MVLKMALNLNRHINRGFSLLELTIVLIIITILASAIVPQLINGYLIKAANKTALDMSSIEEASRAYYLENNNWPTNIAALQTGNYLPSTWNVINPFGLSASAPSNYTYNISSTGPALTVSTFVPTAAEPTIQNLLPVTSVSGNTINSTVSVPGGASSLQTGTILPWPSNNLPAGFILCDGTIYNVSTYPALAVVLGNLYGGDGLTTFGVPNLQGRTIFGYKSADGNFGVIGSTGGSTTMVGDGQWSSGHADTANWVNQVKISGGSLYGMTGAQTAQGVSTAVLNPFIVLNYIIKT